jgi:hypothetical protein
MESHNWDSLPSESSDVFVYSSGPDIIFNADLASSVTFREGVRDMEPCQDSEIVTHVYL